MPLPWSLRWLSLLAGLGVLGLLVIARVLEPAEEGFGTHQQLGLPPCTSVALFDVTCPACGMTTSWAWVTRGELIRAARANVGGCLLALIALAYLPTVCYFLCGGRTSLQGRFSLLFGGSILAAMAAATLQWVFRLSG